MIEIKLGNIGSEEQAKRIKQKLEGKSFYNFKVHYASMAQNWPVSVTTDYPGAVESEVREMLLFILACRV